MSSFTLSQIYACLGQLQQGSDSGLKGYNGILVFVDLFAKVGCILFACFQLQHVHDQCEGSCCDEQRRWEGGGGRQKRKEEERLRRRREAEEDERGRRRRAREKDEGKKREWSEGEQRVKVGCTQVMQLSILPNSSHCLGTTCRGISTPLHQLSLHPPPLPKVRLCATTTTATTATHPCSGNARMGLLSRLSRTKKRQIFGRFVLGWMPALRCSLSLSLHSPATPRHGSNTGLTLDCS